MHQKPTGMLGKKLSLLIFYLSVGQVRASATGNHLCGGSVMLGSYAFAAGAPS